MQHTFLKRGRTTFTYPRKYTDAAKYRHTGNSRNWWGPCYAISKEDTFLHDAYIPVYPDIYVY